MAQQLITVKVSGLKELQEALEAKPRNIARRLLRTALKNAAMIWRDEMERTAPQLENPKLASNPKEVRLPGDMARHIGMRVVVNSELEATAYVGPTKRTFWSLFEEFRVGKSSKSGKPFIRAAYESKKQAVLDKIVEEGRKIVEEEGRGNV